MNPNTISVREAAARLGVTKQRVHALVKQGKLRRSADQREPSLNNRLIGRITVASLEALEAEREQAQRNAQNVPTVSLLDVLSGRVQGGGRDE